MKNKKLLGVLIACGVVAILYAVSYLAFAESYRHPRVIVRVIVIDKSHQNGPIVEKTHNEKTEKPLTLKKSDPKRRLKI